MSPRTIGLIGTDSSHAIAFTELLNDPGHPLHVPGCRVLAAWPGGSADFPLSFSRVDTYMNRLETEYGVCRAETPEGVASSCDALMLLSIDGRARVELFARIAPFGKPVFIDKPLAISGREAYELDRLSRTFKAPIFSASALRYAVKSAARELTDRDPIHNANVRGPLQIEPTQSVYYWYGIHLAEMLFALLGTDCLSVRAERHDGFDRLVGTWKDGRTGTAVCDLSGAYVYEASVMTGRRALALSIDPDMSHHYAKLVADAVTFFDSGVAPVPAEETLAIIRFLQAAERSLQAGGIPVGLTI